jgi:hypothetical protein
VRQHSAGGVDATTAPNSAQIVNVETLGRNGVAILWLSAFIGAAAVVTTIAFGFWIDRVSARVYVLEYDVAHICAQLLAEDTIEACH